MALSREQSLGQSLQIQSKAVKAEIEAAFLPEDVLIKVFEYLDPRSKIRASEVCRTWASACSHKAVWKHVISTLHSYNCNSLRQTGIINRGISRFHLLDFKPATQEFMQNLPIVESVRLANDCIRDALSPFFQNLPHLKNLDMAGCSSVSDVRLGYVTALTTLTHLNLSFCVEITDKGLESISQLPNLISLNLTHCQKITDDGLQSISELTNLTYLELSFCKKITSAGIQSISQLKNLKVLNLYDCTAVTNISLRYITQMTSLRALNVGKCNISNMGLVHLANGNLKLTELGFPGCFKITARGLWHLYKSSFALTLQRLDVGGCSVTEIELCETMCEFRNLKILDHAGCRFIWAWRYFY